MPQPGMIQCPACTLELPEDNGQAQVDHMEREHPDVINERLQNAGFRQQGGKWIDTLASDD